MIFKKFGYLTLILLFLLKSPGTFAESAVDAHCKDGMCAASMQSGGKTRTYHYYEHGSPFPNTDNQFRVIFIFHDSFSDGISFDEKVLEKSFDKVTGLRDFVVVYPDAYKKGWNFGPDSMATDVDDVAFTRDLVASFEGTHAAQRVKFYAGGMGNGGLMVFRLGCEMADKLSAISVVDATMPYWLSKTCQPSRPLPLLLFEGYRDPLVPWNKHYMFDLGGLPAIPTLSASETFDLWARLDHFTAPTYFRLVPLAKYDGTVIFVEFKVTRGMEIRLYTIYGAGHTWPGGGQYLPVSYVGKISRNLEASPTMVNFFFAF